MLKFLFILCCSIVLVANSAFSQSGPSILDSSRFSLPPPTGPFAVGRSSYYLVDSSRSDMFSSKGNTARELLVYVWYPANPRTARRSSPYIPYFSRIDQLLGEKEMKNQFGNAYELIKSGKILNHAAENPALPDEPVSFPVLIFSHGFGETGLTYTVMLEELASHGYVVFAIEHPYDAYCVAFPDGHNILFAQAKWDSAKSVPHGAVDYQLAQIPIRAADILFTLNMISRLAEKPGAQFAGHLNLQRIGVFGHSLGGMAAARACQLDLRIKAGINQDADYQGLPFVQHSPGETIHQPFLFFGTHHSIYVSRYITPPTDEQLKEWKMSRVVYDSLMNRWQANQDESLALMPKGSYRIRLESESFVHRSFLDTYLFKDLDNPSVGQRNKEHLVLLSAYTRAYFDKELKGVKHTMLDETPADSSLIFIDRFGAQDRLAK